MKTPIVELPGPCVAAAAGGDTVWCAAGARLLGFAENGARQFDVPLAEGVTHLAVSGASLVAALASGEVAWLDPRSGVLLARRPAGAAPLLVSGGGTVWAVDRSTSQAWRVGESGVIEGSRRLPGVDRVAVGADRLWWTAAGSTLLHDLERTVELGVDMADAGGMVVCAGSLWIASVRRGLIRVGTWAAEKGPLVEAPDGPVPFLTCSGGVLVGASSEGRLFVLDSSSDAAARALDAKPGPATGLVTLGRTAWLFSAARPAVHLVPLGAG